MKIDWYTLIEQSLNYLALHYSNRVDMPCNNISFQILVDYFDNAHENNFENNAWYLKHNADKLLEIQNRVMQGIVSIITSALLHWNM